MYFSPSLLQHTLKSFLFKAQKYCLQLLTPVLSVQTQGIWWLEIKAHIFLLISHQNMKKKKIQSWDHYSYVEIF